MWLYLRMASANFRTGDAAHDGVSPYLVADEAADVLRVKPWQVVQLCRSGRLRATKPGKSWLIHRDDLAAYIASGSNDKSEGAA